MQLVSLIIIRWMEIYPVDSAIRKKKNRNLVRVTDEQWRSFSVTQLLSSPLSSLHLHGFTASARLLEYEC